VAMDETKAHERTSFAFLKKNAASPVSNGITINKTGIINYFSVGRLFPQEKLKHKKQ
jgi:hypothetical protein